MRRTAHFLIAFGAVAFWSARVQAGDYVEAFDGPLPSVMLNGSLTLGTSGAWSTKVADGALVLSNSEAANAIRYIAVENVVFPGTSTPTSTNNDTIELSVRASAEERAGAGVVADFDPRTSNYVLFAVGSHGAYFACRKEQNRVKIIAAGTSQAIKTNAMNKVAVSTKDRALVFSVNGSEILKVSELEPEWPNRRPVAARPRLVGIGAFGRGTFWFDEVRISPAFSPAADPQREMPSTQPLRPADRPGSPGDKLE